MKKIEIKTKDKTYKAYLIESYLLLIIIRFIGSLGIMYPLTVGTKCITLGYFIVGKKGLFYDKQGRETTLLRHEKIHIAQQRELTLIVFGAMYLWYYLYYSIKLRDSNNGYKQIPFEREAYKHQDEQWYLLKRNKNDWKNYKD